MSFIRYKCIIKLEDTHPVDCRLSKSDYIEFTGSGMVTVRLLLSLVQFYVT